MGSRHLTLKHGLDSHVAPESCQWLHDTGEFKAWDTPAVHEGDKQRILVLKGKPGSGKSVLMNWALGRYESLRADTSQGPLILSFFFDARHSEPLNYTLEGFYRSLLSQILSLIPYRAAHKVLANSSRPGKDEKWDIIILKDIILQLLAFVEGQRIVLFLDALDECQENEQYDLQNTADTLEFLKKLLHLDAHIQICLSIRNETILEEFFDSPYVLDIQAHNQPSIKKYLALELQKSKHLRPQFQTKLRSLLFSRSSNMFLWASLVVSDIKTAARSKEREDEILERVNETPKELNELYETMLRHANLGKREEALKLMQLVQVAVRPLTLAEIRSALYFSDDQFDERFSHLTTEDFSHNIHELSGGLIELYSPSFFRDARSPAGKDPTRAVQFIHVSVRDFIRQGRGVCELSTLSCTQLTRSLRLNITSAWLKLAWTYSQPRQLSAWPTPRFKSPPNDLHSCNMQVITGPCMLAKQTMPWMSISSVQPTWPNVPCTPKPSSSCSENTNPSGSILTRMTFLTAATLDAVYRNAITARMPETVKTAYSSCWLLRAVLSS